MERYSKPLVRFETRCSIMEYALLYRPDKLLPILAQIISNLKKNVQRYREIWRCPDGKWCLSDWTVSVAFHLCLHFIGPLGNSTFLNSHSGFKEDYCNKLYILVSPPHIYSMTFLRCSPVLGEITSDTFNFPQVVFRPGENVVNNLFSISFDRSFKK